MQETQDTWVQSLGWEDPLEEEMTTHFSSLAWLNPMDRGAWKATVHGIAKSWARQSMHALPVKFLKRLLQKKKKKQKKKEREGDGKKLCKGQ